MIFAMACAVLAAGSNAWGTVLQRRAATTTPESRSPFALALALVRNPLWLGGILGVVGSALFQALALNFGSLAAVQPIFILELPLALLFGSMVFHVQVSRKAWGSVVAIFAGLAISLFSAAPTGGREQVPGMWWIPTILAVAAVEAVLIGIGLRRPHGVARAACLAAAAAVGNALTAAFVKSATHILSRQGTAAFFLAWQTYAFAVVGSLSIILLGYAMQGGPLIASQPALTLGDAVVSFCLGVTLFAESPRRGLWLIPALLGVALLSYGVFTLSRTRCLAKCVDRDETGEDQARQSTAAATVR
ncbi:DMT family transporter [Streptomyces sp. NPDC101237]|uniref:DMT family transporter n=1 Tax=Streptomyces sp. NPDC101237 TaxID=3366139 RepID=UPI00380250ED